MPRRHLLHGVSQFARGIERATSRNVSISVVLDLQTPYSSLSSAVDRQEDVEDVPGPLSHHNKVSDRDLHTEPRLLAKGGIVGAPNAGKSTLINALVGRKISAASSKTNTTALCRLGAFTEGSRQVVLYDTPGIVEASRYRNARHKNNVESAWKIASQCDTLLCVVDAARQIEVPDMRVVRMVENLGYCKRGEDGSQHVHVSKMLGKGVQFPRSALILNKVDIIDAKEHPRLSMLAEEFAELGSFDDVFWTSALREKGIMELKKYLLKSATPGEWMVESDEATNVSKEDHAAEIVREKIFVFLYHEVPYRLQLRLVSSDYFADSSIRIEFDILTPSEIVRRMVVGRNGSTIRAIGRAARLELEKIWGRRVHLFLNAKYESTKYV